MGAALYHWALPGLKKNVKDLDVHVDLCLDCVDTRAAVQALSLDLLSFGLSSLQLVQMDMSNSTIPTPALESIIGGCRLLEYLSLEGLQLSDAIIT